MVSGPPRRDLDVLDPVQVLVMVPDVAGNAPWTDEMSMVWTMLAPLNTNLRCQPGLDTSLPSPGSNERVRCRCRAGRVVARPPTTVSLRRPEQTIGA